jgi:type IV pilus assembly protein PilQ
MWRYGGVVPLILSLGSGSAWAANTLHDVSVTALDDRTVEVALSMSDAGVEVASFSLDDPPRVVVDLPDTRLAAEPATRVVDLGIVQSWRGIEAAGRTRLVIDLEQSASERIRVEGTKAFVAIAPREVVVPEGAPAQATAQPMATGPRITDIEFRRGEGGRARVHVELSDPMVPIDMRRQGRQILVEFLNASIAPELVRRLDVTDFGTPVAFVDSFASGRNVQLTLVTTGEFSHLGYQVGPRYTIEVRTEETGGAEQRDGDEFTGERLSLSFQDIDVRAVLDILADFTGLNIVVSDSVSGSLTLRLNNVPWDQALDLVLKTQGLAMRRSGNVILVAPAAELTAQERLELESRSQLSELAPIRSEVFKIRYARAEDLAELIAGQELGLVEDEGQTSGPQLLSARGLVISDERTNTLIIYETAERLADIRELIERLDIPVRQVLIESRIVNVEDNYFQSIGVRFGAAVDATSVTEGGNVEPTVVGGTVEGNLVIEPTTGFESPAGSGVEGLISSFPATAIAGASPAAIQLLVGKIGTRLLQLELSALQQDGRAEVISSPRVITADQQTAEISQGSLIPFQESAGASGATSTSFQEAVLKLNVTPQITPDDRINMTLEVTDDQPAALVANSAINTARVTTQVLIDDGDTVVLGGIFRENRRETVNKVPFFGDLPVVGVLFRDRTANRQKSELLVFITPRILPEELPE